MKPSKCTSRPDCPCSFCVNVRAEIAEGRTEKTNWKILRKTSSARSRTANEDDKSVTRARQSATPPTVQRRSGHNRLGPPVGSVPKTISAPRTQEGLTGTWSTWYKIRPEGATHGPR
jgi:hypothetical protein